LKGGRKGKKTSLGKGSESVSREKTNLKEKLEKKGDRGKGEEGKGRPGRK